MVAETVSRKPRAAAPPRMLKKGPVEHDLPVLAATLAPVTRLDWAPLLDRGVTPCLVLGAERRARGPR